VSARIAVGITTRDRPDALRSCLASLDLAGPLVAECLVFDDGSREPAEGIVARAGRSAVTVIRDADSPGYIVGRNRLVRAAGQPYVLLLDDDARLLSREALVLALDILENDSEVGAVGFAQAERDGRPWGAHMQPSPARDPRRVRSFIGFAHLLRRDLFLALGGYRECFRHYGEEKEYCLRLMEAGHSVVYLPDALVAHVPDPNGRDPRRYLRYVARNDCLNALLNDPVRRLMWTLPARLALYWRMRYGWRVHDPGGFRWLLTELIESRREIRRLRRPVSDRTLARWRALGREGEPYRTSRAAGGWSS